MADKKTECGKRYRIVVDCNPDYCGVDACGVQFSHGQAETGDARAAAWFAEHDGYTVTEAGEQS